MDYESKIKHRNSNWFMRQLEEYLAHEDLVGENDWPSWISV